MTTKAPKLIYVDDDLPGITRKGAGTGWAYYDPDGNRITDAAERKRLNAVALPPAYEDAWFCPAGNGHILATGVDDKGRKQYRYHPDFRSFRDGEKFDGCVDFGRKLPLVRARVEAELRARKPSRSRAIASVVRLLDLGAIRVGNESYAKRNNSFGATTLRQQHAEISDGQLVLEYRGKGGKDREVAVDDRALIRAVITMQDLPGQHLFQWLGDDGAAHSVSSSCVNDYLTEAMGGSFTAKNFRTWHASVMGFAILSRAKERLTLKAVMEEVAEHLGNTPAITRSAYVHPAVIALVERQEEWRADLRLPRRTKWLSREERGLIALLEESPSAGELLAAA